LALKLFGKARRTWESSASKNALLSLFHGDFLQASGMIRAIFIAGLVVLAVILYAFGNVRDGFWGFGKRGSGAEKNRTTRSFLV
jgi:hypothetical protein